MPELRLVPLVIGVSLSEPHTDRYSRKSLYLCVYVCMYPWYIVHVFCMHAQCTYTVY